MKSVPIEACLTWTAVQEKVPWGVVILVGGGLAMAKAMEKSNMSAMITEQMLDLEILPKEAILILVTLMTTTVTQAVSNPDTASILLPVVKELVWIVHNIQLVKCHEIIKFDVLWNLLIYIYIMYS